MKYNNTVLPPCSKFKKAPVIPPDGRLKTIASGTAEVFKLDPRIISRDPGFNKRYDFGNIQLLAEDILENGILEALKVRKDGTTVYLVNGDRRLSAVELLISNNLWPADPKNPGYPLPIPCTSEGVGVNPLDRIFMMLSLNTGKPFTLLEKAFAYQEILAQNPKINASEIARRSGETKQAVSNALQIVNHASTELIQHVKEDRISATTALEIIKSTTSHEEQNEAAKKAIESASQSGRNHATPKDLDLPEKKPRKHSETSWAYESAEGAFNWNENDVAADPNSIVATVPKSTGIGLISIHTAMAADGTWRHAYTIHIKTSRTSGLPSLNGHASSSESEAIHRAWSEIAPHIARHAKTMPPIPGEACRLIAISLGQLLYEAWVTDRKHDDTMFHLPGNSTSTQPSGGDESFIADLSDEDDEKDDADPAADSSTPERSDSPADPDAYKRIKDAPESNKDGSLSGGNGGGSGGGFGPGSSDARLKNIESMLDELEKENCHPDRWDTIELILDYLNGAHTIATIKKHLKTPE